ncbi:uncharacterized protein LY79DRAFT_547770 [Colletotrichum navitas]|uniref:Uncharacterized protein n=1 Tax=Colletotrichum navitas TaxID=681940 RepID=A0AAD8Q3Q7_9PEZI|nr:uncharacterized protein LY79DRAFT_547770 [Colletotrichum navitas]KAK1595015.1 hypothetical protein LY79DRAFT_547770 [Colletotrichum navitas]
MQDDGGWWAAVLVICLSAPMRGWLGCRYWRLLGRVEHEIASIHYLHCPAASVQSIRCLCGWLSRVVGGGRGANGGLRVCVQDPRLHSKLP